MNAALLDTSVFIASETGRPLRYELLPDQWAVSVITVAELQAGVLAAKDLASRARRLATLHQISELSPLPIDEAVARRWAELRVLLAQSGRKLNVNDLWIAATALTNNLSLATQDDDFDTIAEISGLNLIKV